MAKKRECGVRLTVYIPYQQMYVLQWAKNKAVLHKSSISAWLIAAAERGIEEIGVEKARIK